MNEQLLLDHIREVLNRLEETIIFGLIERGQFRRNEVIYRPGALGDALGGESLVGYLLRETERIHARMRRYTSPDEHPFYQGLPVPILGTLRYEENPLRPNHININARIRAVYETNIVPAICEEGDDSQYGSSAVEDVALLQALSKRIHYGKFVAESKYRGDPEKFRSLLARRDADELMDAITNPDVERAVLDRVEEKTRTYARECFARRPAARVSAAVVADLYARWIIPLNKQVQVAYLLETHAAAPSSPAS